MKAEEGYVDVPGGKVWYRAVGDDAEATPLLCLHGGPRAPGLPGARPR
jgi:pimeloyl-ACP methyl ester carboxylesterase